MYKEYEKFNVEIKLLSLMLEGFLVYSPESSVVSGRNTNNPISENIV